MVDDEVAEGLDGGEVGEDGGEQDVRCECLLTGVITSSLPRLLATHLLAQCLYARLIAESERRCVTRRALERCLGAWSRWCWWLGR